MKTYTPIPTLSGVISDDYLFYEGTSRPQIFYTLSDGGEEKMSRDKILELEGYWNDLYNLFLRKLTTFAGSNSSSDEEVLKLQALLQELIKTKSLIEKAPRTDIMRR